MYASKGSRNVRMTFGSFFSGVFFISVPSAGDASKEHASKGTTTHRTQMTWSPVRTIGTEIGRHAEISMIMAAVKDPRNRKESASLTQNTHTGERGT